MVLITHEMAVIRQICNRVAILDGGRIAEEGTVDDVFVHTKSAAGKRLYKSHSSVSRTVSALERELGVALAVRDRNSFALTPAGRTLYERGRDLLKAAEELEISVKEAETK